jgi:hypothetical protein
VWLLDDFELLVAWAEEGNSNRKSAAAGRRASVDVCILLNQSYDFISYSQVEF